MIKLNADIDNGCYGTWEYDSKNKNYKFNALGKAVYLVYETHDIETGAVGMKLEFDYLGESKAITISRKEISDIKLIEILAEQGADVTKRHFNVLVDSLRKQEFNMELSGQAVEKVYTHLGWQYVSTTDNNGNEQKLLCYRANTLLGSIKANYAGKLKVEAMGTYEVWREMVQQDVLGYTKLEIILLAGLSAVVNGLICESTTGENPIIHINGTSGSGKSTAAMLAASVFGEPFDGKKIVPTTDGEYKSLLSMYGSWGGTENAIMNRCVGNHGAVIILNELGKFGGKDLSRLVYSFSEGTDKDRLTTHIQANVSESFKTTIISIGEMSLLGRCKSKMDGLSNRVFELDAPLTSSASQSDHIKEVCVNHNGHAATMMASYILENGGLMYVLKIYKEIRSKLLLTWPDTPSKERFVSKFPALFLTTAELAQEALGITFSQKAIEEYFRNHDLKNGSKRNSAAASYDMIIEECRIHYTNFHSENSLACSKEVWGAIKKVRRALPNGKQVVSEYMIRPSIVAKILAEKGFENISTCIEAWEQAGVISRDKDRPTRSRKIGPKADRPEDVYVFYVFAGEEDSMDKEERNKPNTTKPRTLSPSLRMLLQDSDDDDEDKDKEKGDGNVSVT